jgi:hypothetical protein
MKPKHKKSSEVSLPEGVYQHKNGLFYKLIDIPGLDEPLKIFNTRKPARLEEETYQEYKIRQKFNKNHEKNKSREVWYSAIDEGRNAYWKAVEDIQKIKDPKE